MIERKNIAQWLRGLMGPMGLIGPMGLMRPSRLMGLIGLIGLMGLLGACSSGDEEPVPEEAVEIPVQVQGFVSRYTETAPITRGWDLPSGFELYPSEEVIAINFTKNDQEPKQGHFFKGSDGWRTSIEISSSEITEPNTPTFYLYGYVPHTAGITSSITDLDGANANYRTGAILTLTNVPTIMAKDLCVVIGAKNGMTSYEAPPADYSVTGLRRGDFAYDAAVIKKASGGDPASGSGNFVYLLFDHLYAGLNVSIKVDGDYNDLRTIKLKSLQLEASDDEDHAIKEHTNITVTLEAKDTDANPITDVTYSPHLSSNAANATIFESGAGFTLTDAYQQFTSHFIPTGVVKLILTSTYDVYDKNDNLVREDCKATNVIDFSKLVSYFEEVRRGTKYNVKMTVNPTYLYMLSEPDLNNPTVEID